MKRFLRFCMILIVVMILAYLQPVFFPKKMVEDAQQSDEVKIESTYKALPYLELDATGFAAYIGRSVQTLKVIYGEPNEIKPSGLNYQWWIYGTGGDHYFQVAVRDNLIDSIFVLGDGDDLSPFEIGMDLADISDISTIFSDFSFSYQEQKYEIELTEEDMNDRPLMAFNNGSFAVLQMNQQNGKLLAIRYFNKESLLQLMPYQLNKGERLPLVAASEVDIVAVNQSNSEQLLKIMNILRERGDYPPYEQNVQLKISSEKALGEFLNAPEKIIEDAKRLKLWDNYTKAEIAAEPFTLTSKEFAHLLKLDKVGQAELHGILVVSACDVPWLVLNWYGDLASQNQFRHPNDREIGVAFSENGILFLISEGKPETSTTTQSTGD